MKPSTLAIHAGARVHSRARPLVPAIHASVVSSFEDADALDQALDGNDFTYGRISAQNTSMLEEALAALEGAEDCAAYASGMAALKAVLEAEVKKGDRVVIASDGYGVTRALFKRMCLERGIELLPLALAEPDAPDRLREARARLVVAESVTNPRLSVPDLTALAEATHAGGGVLAVDGTFSSPALQRTLTQGADYAVQSTTKWLNGHSDAVGGSVAGSKERIGALKKARILDGAILGPFEAWLTLRGVRTLIVRMRAHCEHAQRIASRLKGAPGIERVLYPGLADHPQHAVAQRMMTGGFGGMLAFEMKGAERQEGFRFLEAVRVCQPAPSLGDVTTLVMHAASASARRMTPEERKAAGIGENLIRVSVGLEDPDDVADDLLQAVSKALQAKGR